MPNVVTYCPVSSDEQAQKDLSIPAQLINQFYSMNLATESDHCGSRFVGRRQKKTPKNGAEPYDYFRYYCNGYITKGRRVCPPVGIHREWLEAPEETVGSRAAPPRLPPAALSLDGGPSR